jgi:hypothetical protein
MASGAAAVAASGRVDGLLWSMFISAAEVREEAQLFRGKNISTGGR